MAAPVRWTEGLPGSGGVLGRSASDFEVHEELAYPLSGEGEHLFVRVEKRDLTTLDAMGRLVRALGLPRSAERNVGCAGMKDRHAVATQWLSVPWPIAQAMPNLEQLAAPPLRVLELTRHNNKLRRGHVKANRFRITLREVPEGGLERAQASLQSLHARGVPNRFGPQRFGASGSNVEDALGFVVHGRPPPRSRRMQELLVSALQSEIYNRVLERRIRERTLAVALAGDVMQKHATGGLFQVDDPAVEQPRVDALEISPTGALPGRRYRAGAGLPLAMEAEAMAEVGVSVEALARWADGTRRVLRYPLSPDTQLLPAGPDAFILEVTLPSGAYATVLLDELVKPSGALFDRADGD